MYNYYSVYYGNMYTIREAYRKDDEAVISGAPVMVIHYKKCIYGLKAMLYGNLQT